MKRGSSTYALKRAFRRLRQTSWRERQLLLEAAALLPVVHVMQQKLSFRRWRELLERESPRSARAADAPSVDQIAWAVTAARNWVPGEYKCLPSAYTAHLLLHRYGYDSEIYVGVARDEQGQVEAHAWVDVQGRTVIGWVQDMARFVPFPPLRSVKR